MRFDFNETNILSQNLFMHNDTKDTLLERLHHLILPKDDMILKSSVSSLIQKIEKLTPEQVKQIFSDKENGLLIATANIDYGVER